MPPVLLLMPGKGSLPEELRDRPDQAMFLFNEPFDQMHLVGPGSEGKGCAMVSVVMKAGPLEEGQTHQESSSANLPNSLGKHGQEHLRHIHNFADFSKYRLPQSCLELWLSSITSLVTFFSLGLWNSTEGVQLVGQSLFLCKYEQVADGQMYNISEI